MATNAERITDLRSQLVTVKAAISQAVTCGQSASKGDKSLTRANLSVLLSERRQLERDIQRLESGGGRAMQMDMSCSPYGGNANA